MMMKVELVDMHSCIYCSDKQAEADLYPSSPNTVEAVGGLVFESSDLLSI